MKLKTILLTFAVPAAFGTEVITSNTPTFTDPSLANNAVTEAPADLANAEEMIEAPATNSAAGVSFDINVGTQGLGLSIGYEFNKYLKMRVRGAYLDLNYEDTWDDVDAELEYDGNNAGLIFDYHPFGGVFHLSAGLNFSKMTLSATGSMEHEYAGTYELGGYTFEVVGNKGELEAEYDWNDIQPYLGIGWSTDGAGDRSLYFTLDIGVNFIGSGKFSINKVQGIGSVTGPNGEDLGYVTDKIVEDAVREEGKDFFEIADDIFIYPVIQFGMGYRF